jgi:sterol desaturase/sphingolipid hydroxylase (fatty acid hydroxylase superfamily)
MHALLDLFEAMSPWQAAWWILVENFSLFFVVLVAGEWLTQRYRDRPTGPPADPLTWQEIGLAISCVLGNSLVTGVGWLLWKSGWIVVRRDLGPRVLLDVFVLIAAMDFAMYVSHRIAHLPLIYPIVHQTHHRYDRPRPIDLFVLNPFEVIGFGGMWLGLVMIYTSSWLGILIYLTLNLIFGMVGHLGVEPLRPSWIQHQWLCNLGTSSFHAGHHQSYCYNYGFYTLIWDKLFGTLHPDYLVQFGKPAQMQDGEEIPSSKSD